MTVRELYGYLDARIPSSLSCEWDNDGLMCCPDGSRDVKKVLIALDVTADVVREAVSSGTDVIVSHHPFVFHGLKVLDENNNIPRKAMKLIKNGISVFSFHTRLDALHGGVNDVLAVKLGVGNSVPFDDGTGRIGELVNEIPLEEFAENVKKALGAPFVLVSDAKRNVKRVALLGGEGGDETEAAKRAGADTYISGRLGYHNMTDAPDCGINLIEAGHFYTENPVCGVLADMVRSAGDIECTVYNSNRIKFI